MTNKTLKDEAVSFTGKNLKNISELKSVSVDLVVYDFKDTNANGEEYEYKYIEIEDKQYRIPPSVLSSLKQILEKKPQLKTFAVSKTGEGLNTKYTVIPLE